MPTENGSASREERIQEFIGEHLFVAVGSDDRVEPVVAETPQQCAQRAADAMELDSRASDLENWERRHRGPKVDEYMHWRWLNGDTRWFDYVSIHSIDPETGRGGTS